ncbi:MAG: hypothetical protein QG632_181 [Candidatus Dependentiae bacterium]|nr:hypothetical protein [Candidatus Dependentiae bacterium]
MKLNPQIIYKDKAPEYALLPIKQYNKIVELLEDLEDLQDIKKIKEANEENFPLEIAQQLATDKSPIAIFREYRNLSQTALAEMVNVSKQYISQLEKGDRTGTTKVLKAIAKALQVDFDLITE